MDKEQVVCRCTNVTIGDLVRDIFSKLIEL